MDQAVKRFSLFVGHQWVAQGTLLEVVTAALPFNRQGGPERVAVYDEQTGRSVDIDYSGGDSEVLQRVSEHPLLRTASAAAEEEKRGGPGRPRIGVVSREVSLLPRHWEWLNSQSNGASGTIRMLVEEARKKNAGRDRARQLRDSLHQFLWDMAGDFPNFEEATRAYFASDFERFRYFTSDWPGDVLRYVAPRLNELEAMKEQLV